MESNNFKIGIVKGNVFQFVLSIPYQEEIKYEGIKTLAEVENIKNELYKLINFFLSNSESIAENGFSINKSKLEEPKLNTFNIEDDMVLGVVFNGTYNDSLLTLIRNKNTENKEINDSFNESSPELKICELLIRLGYGFEFGVKEENSDIMKDKISSSSEIDYTKLLVGNVLDSNKDYFMQIPIEENKKEDLLSLRDKYINPFFDRLAEGAKIEIITFLKFIIDVFKTDNNIETENINCLSLSQLQLKIADKQNEKPETKLFDEEAKNMVILFFQNNLDIYSKFINLCHSDYNKFNQKLPVPDKYLVE